MRALHSLLAVLLVLAAAGAGVPAGGAGSPAPAAADAPSPTGDRPDVGAAGAQVDRPATPPEAVNALGLRSGVANRSGFAAAYVDVGPALGLEAATTSRRLETVRALERVRAAESDAERAARIRAELRRIEERTDALGRTQGRLVAEYAEEGRTAGALLVGLVEVDREARALDERRQRLWAVANRTDAPVADGRFAAVGRELDAYTGPVRARAAAALTGAADPGRFYVAGAPRSLVLATVSGNTYLREAYRGDLRRIGTDAVNASAADAVAAGYPEVWRARERATVDGGRIARVRVGYPGGSLEALVGSGNERVFADEHRRVLRTAGTNTTAVNTRDGLRMTVNRSYPGGAMRLQLRDADGNRVNASVTIGPAGGQSVAVGHTGDDGELWLVTPGERFTVVAIRDQSVVFLTMSPLSTPEPGPSGGSGGDR
ncbi:MAG: hypothetical protein ABEH40_08780 [Haloferacaceae archaeon]